MEFRIDKKGYNPKQVEDYVSEVKKVYEEALEKQKDRIFELKASLSALETQVKEYKEKKGLISKAIINAVAKAEEIEHLSQVKYNQEITQLNAFHDKWTIYYNKILDRYPLDDQLAAAGRFNGQMAKILTRAEKGENVFKISEAEETFAKESDRLSETQIGYIRVKTDDVTASTESEDEGFLNDIIPGADPNSPIMSGIFDPLERINRYFAAEKQSAEKQSIKKDTTKNNEVGNKTNETASTITTDSKQPQKAKPAEGQYSDRSPSGFSIEECLNPKEDLSQIMRDLGLLLED